MREGMLHIRDVEGPKKTGSVETRLKAIEQQVFKCQGMVEHGLNANHVMITKFTNKHMIDANDIGKHLSRLYDRVDQLQGQIYDLQNQNCRRCPLSMVCPGVRGSGTLYITGTPLWPSALDGTDFDNQAGRRRLSCTETKTLHGPWPRCRHSSLERLS
ncbi:40S ribosomal protein S5-1 [Hordeum vulgare]|nr:40S ribosomal protein S5-1 [Hordeum vulgare]